VCEDARYRTSCGTVSGCGEGDHLCRRRPRWCVAWFPGAFPSSPLTVDRRRSVYPMHVPKDAHVLRRIYVDIPSLCGFDYAPKLRFCDICVYSHASCDPAHLSPSLLIDLNLPWPSGRAGCDRSRSPRGASVECSSALIAARLTMITVRRARGRCMVCGRDITRRRPPWS
jgi:hypothetical protein